MTNPLSRPTKKQTLIVVALGVVTAALLYRHWFQACCRDAFEIPLLVLFFPAFLIGLLLAGENIHGGSEVNFYIGKSGVLLDLVACKVGQAETEHCVRLNTLIKIAPFSRWTPPKSGAFYFGR